jgi:hypothetical protein
LENQQFPQRPNFLSQKTENGPKSPNAGLFPCDRLIIHENKEVDKRAKKILYQMVDFSIQIFYNHFMGNIFTSGFNEYTNVSIGDKFTNEHSYIIGYWEAGDVLVDKALTLSHPYKDRLFFPICYNYRQFLELILKQLIIDSEIIYNSCKSINVQNKENDHKFSEKVNTTHNIEKLLNWLILNLNCITNEKIDKNIIKSIIEYHHMDETGQKFRYPRSLKNEKHFTIREDFDLEKIKRIANYFTGIHCYLFEYSKFVNSYIREIEETIYPCNYFQY